MKFKLNRFSILRMLLICVGILLVGNLITVFLLVKYPITSLEGSFYSKLTALFNFNLEANLPTFFSALVLLGNGILLALIAFGHKQVNQKYWHWVGMALVFCFLSFDEMIKIHEHLRMPTERLLNTSGYFKFAWFIPYGILVIILGIAYAKFLLKLPKRTLRLFILAAVLFLGGAIGMEAIGGMHDETYGQNNLTYYIMYTIEELMEMAGSIVFFFALIAYIRLTFETITFRFQPKKDDIVNS